MTFVRRILLAVFALAVGYGLSRLVTGQDRRRITDAGNRGVTIVRERVVDLRTHVVERFGAGDEGAISYDEIHLVTDQVSPAGDDHETGADLAAELEADQIQDEDDRKSP